MKKLKQTGKPRQFDTGAQRDNAEGKLRMSLIPHKGRKGMKHSVLYDSAMRHLMQDFQGDDSEDHLGAALWNIMCMIWNRDNKPEMDDRKEYEQSI